ncbi:putative ABC transport system permease protein [Pedobacter sp. CAN_A7]|uniref:ABC transporter permease n=1 Tax=Pedobacter sp. CAN_A7 TaxID=2787722 RepID=UPI001A3484C5
MISWKSMCAKPLSSAINMLLVALGIGILTVLLLVVHQISAKLSNNAKGIDLVVGAKGSPLQLILSSIYHIDFPTGNIPMVEAEKLMHHPWVKSAVPLALGDNYHGVRIVGTDSNFLKLYKLKIKTGKFWKHDFETTIGARVAEEQSLKVGDYFYGSHGLTENSSIHKNYAYKVTGILEPQGNVTDNLILTNISSIWHMHNTSNDDHNHQHGEDYNETASNGHKEITTLLIQYRSPMAVVQFPRMVNQSTNMQAASPATESTRLFSLIGVGIDTLQWFAVLIMAIAAISVFVNLYNSLKERNYDLAVMRILGASRGKLFFIVIIEGIIVTVAGAFMGIALGHVVLEFIAHYQENSEAALTGLIIISDEIYLMVFGLTIGIIAALFPALQAYCTPIDDVLKKN